MVVGRELLLEDLVVERLVVVVGRVRLLEDRVVERLVVDVVVGPVLLLLEDTVLERLVVDVGRALLFEDLVVFCFMDRLFARVLDLLRVVAFKTLLLLRDDELLRYLEFLEPL